MWKTIVRSVIAFFGRRKPAAAVRAFESSTTPAPALKNRQLGAVFGVLALLYAVWPIDLIPDFIPFLGWADDAIALALAGYQLMQAYRREPAPIPVRWDA